MSYVRTFLLVAVISGTMIHVITREPMPWWPDTAIMGATFGMVAALGMIQHRRRNIWAWDALKRIFRQP